MSIAMGQAAPGPLFGTDCLAGALTEAKTFSVCD
jgi:hypothetical protein